MAVSVLKTYERRILELCKKHKTVFIYLSKKDEVETGGVIKEFITLGKIVCVPVCNVLTKELLISGLKDLKSTKKGAYGIDEPKNFIPVQKEEIDIFFVPGTLFDRKGNRKGRGEGYFDRFLKDIKGKKKIVGLCRKNQLKEKIIANSWDVPVDEVIVAD